MQENRSSIDRHRVWKDARLPIELKLFVFQLPRVSFMLCKEPICNGLYRSSKRFWPQNYVASSSSLLARKFECRLADHWLLHAEEKDKFIGFVSQLLIKELLCGSIHIFVYQCFSCIDCFARCLRCTGNT